MIAEAINCKSQYFVTTIFRGVHITLVKNLILAHEVNFNRQKMCMTREKTFLVIQNY